MSCIMGLKRHIVLSKLLKDLLLQRSLLNSSANAELVVMSFSLYISLWSIIFELSITLTINSDIACSRVFDFCDINNLSIVANSSDTFALPANDSGKFFNLRLINSQSIFHV